MNGIIKGEFELKKYAHNKQMLKLLATDSIDIYNKQRPHYFCRMLTPNQMHKQQNMRIRTYKKEVVHKGTLVDY